MQQGQVVVRELAAGIAIACLALVARFALDPLLGPHQPYAPGFAAVAAAVWFFGWRAGTAAALLTFMGGTYFFVEPKGSWSLNRPADVVSIISYLTSYGLLIWFGHLARKSKEEKDRAVKQAERFISMVAHELRGPLGAATNAIQLLRDQETRAAAKEGALLIANRQLAMMSSLVGDLLDWGRITRDQLSFHATSVDLRACAEEAMAAVQSLAYGKGQRLVLEAPACVAVTADRNRVVQILFSLLDNACKYSPDEATVELRIRDGDPVVVEVADSGTGFPPGLLPRVFEFDKSSASHESGSDGLGLGLPITKKLVEMHGGSISAARCPRLGGACVTVHLPSMDRAAA